MLAVLACRVQVFNGEGRPQGSYEAYRDALGVKGCTWNASGQLLAVGSCDEVGDSVMTCDEVGEGVTSQAMGPHARRLQLFQPGTCLENNAYIARTRTDATVQCTSCIVCKFS
jgi:hypothetical protein